MVHKKVEERGELMVRSEERMSLVGGTSSIHGLNVPGLKYISTYLVLQLFFWFFFFFGGGGGGGGGF